MQELAINLMAAKMSAALALEGQFSQEGLAALTEGSGGSLATELAKRFVGNNIEGVESAESIWGKMSIDASKLTVVATAPSAEAHEEDVLEQWNGLNTSVDAVMPSIRTFFTQIPYTRRFWLGLRSRYRPTFSRVLSNKQVLLSKTS